MHAAPNSGPLALAYRGRKAYEILPSIAMLDLRSGAANVAADALGTVSSFCRGFGHDCGHSHLEALISLPFLMSDGPAEGHPCLAKPRQFGLAHAKGEGAQILAIERQDVEGIQLDFVIVLARVQGIEIGNTVNPKDDSFAINELICSTPRATRRVFQTSQT
jgi:hypothetical protein